MGYFNGSRFVVRDLITCLNNRDEPPDLQRRLELVPRELDDLFDSMLANIEPFYLDQPAQLFLLARASYAIADKSTLALLDGPGGVSPSGLDALTVSFAVDTDPELVAKVEVGMSRTEIESRQEKIKNQLKVRCAGLLETGKGDTIEYLHLTVRDYLNRPDVLGTFISRT